MKNLHCETLGELDEAIGSISPDALFRGQTREYLDVDGKPSITTSFSRHGCIPSRMIKWFHYSRLILSSFVKDFDPRSDAAIDQAILQHYGWRSFFVDATADPAVAAWFAANRYYSKDQIELCEDCWEDPICKVRTYAGYEPSSGTGCIYAISRKALRSLSINAVDLVEIMTVKGTPRFRAQSAFMIGHLAEGLPSECLIAKITAPSSVFSDYAKRNGDLSMERLFPHSKDDPVLLSLLSLPWVKRDIGPGGIDFFDRGLPLPEYYNGYVKIARSSTAFYRRFWIDDLAKEDDAPRPTSYFTSESLYHGTASDPTLLPALAELVRDKKEVIIEIDGLVYHPYGSPTSYGKGIFLRSEPNGAILLSELMVDQEGGRPTTFGVARGRFYSSDESGRWTRVPHPEECDCGHDQHHGHHLIVAKHFEYALTRGSFTRFRDGVYIAGDVVPATDPFIARLMKE